MYFGKYVVIFSSRTTYTPVLKVLESVWWGKDFGEDAVILVLNSIARGAII